MQYFYRVVDFSYMPDLAMENARNVTINLKEEHGQYVMLQLAFAAKWILISEITFFSGKKIKINIADFVLLSLFEYIIIYLTRKNNFSLFLVLNRAESRKIVCCK